MAKAKNEKFMTPKKGGSFHLGRHSFKAGDKISEALLKDKDGNIRDFKSLEKWKEPPKNQPKDEPKKKEKDDKKNDDQPPPIEE